MRSSLLHPVTEMWRQEKDPGKAMMSYLWQPDEELEVRIEGGSILGLKEKAGKGKGSNRDEDSRCWQSEKAVKTK